MNKLIVGCCILVFATAAAGCGGQRRTTTTTHQSVETTPADPIVVEKRTSTQVETHTTE